MLLTKLLEFEARDKVPMADMQLQFYSFDNKVTFYGMWLLYPGTVGQSQHSKGINFNYIETLTYTNVRSNTYTDELWS